MKLIIIHGPPAAGKLTTANEIAAATGFKVFHNHLSIDCVRPVFDFGTLPFAKLVEKIRLETITAAAREGVDLIHTFVYAFGPDDNHFRRLIAAAEYSGAEVHLVLLKCGREEALRRVTSETRLRMGKLASYESLNSLFDTWEMYEPLPGRETLVINNTKMTAAQTARRIIEQFGLKQPCSE